MATQELTFNISANPAAVKAAMAQVRSELSATAQVQKSTTQGELSMRQQLAAAASLQRQRSAALIQQWKQQEAAAKQLASGIRPVGENLQRITDVMQTLRSTTATLEGPLGGIAGRLGSVASLATEASSGLGVAAVAVGGVGAAALVGELGLLALHKALFQVITDAAEWRGALFDTSQQLGISTETLSAFEILAKTTGGDLGAISASLGIFQKHLESAQDPTSKEAKLLKELGVEANNTEDALRQTLTRLAAMPEGFTQTAKALELFGRGGKSVLAILKEVDGDLDGAIAKFREMGLVVSQEDAKAADQFNDQLAILQFQFRALIGKEGIPAALAALKDLSEFLEKNKGATDALGFGVGILSTLLGGEFQRSIQLVNQAWRQAEAPLLVVAALYERIAVATGLIKRVDFSTATGGVGTVAPPEFGGDVSGGAGLFRKRGRGGSGAGGGSTAESEEEREEKRRIANYQKLQEEIKKLTAELKFIDTSTRSYAVAQSILNGELSRASGPVQEQHRLAAKTADNLTTQLRLQKELGAFVKEQAEAVRLALFGEKSNLKVAQEFIATLERQGAVLQETTKWWLQFNATILDAKQKIEGLSAAYAAMELPGPSGSLAEDPNPIKDTSIFGVPPVPEAEGDAWTDLLQSIKREMVDVSAFMGSTLVNSFHAMSGAIGEAIAAWALYGESIGKAVRKALAASLAGIAADAAIQALYHAAYAIGRFAFGDAAGATKHLIAAAKFGAVAIAAGVGAKIVAGTAFQATSSAAAGSAGGSSGSGNAHSPSKPKAQDFDRRNLNTPPINVHVTVTGQATEGFKYMVEKAVVDSVRTNGPMRKIQQGEDV